MDKKNNNDKQANNIQFMPICMSVGIGIGMAIGGGMGNMAVGMCIGLCVGMCMGVIIDYAHSQKRGTDAATNDEEE